MNIKEQLEAARVLYYQALDLTSSLNNAAYQTQYKSERHDRLERLILKNKVRIHLRFERVLKLHDAYIAELGQKDASFKDSSLSDSTGLALSPAQPVEAVGQGATASCEIGENVMKMTIKPGQVIQIVHPSTGTVLSVAVDLSREFMRIKHVSNDDGLGLSWDSSSERFIDSMLNSDGE